MKKAAGFKRLHKNEVSLRNKTEEKPDVLDNASWSASRRSEMALKSDRYLACALLDH